MTQRNIKNSTQFFLKIQTGRGLPVGYLHWRRGVAFEQGNTKKQIHLVIRERGLKPGNSAPLGNTASPKDYRNN